MIPLSPKASSALNGANGKTTLGIRPEFVECEFEQQPDTTSATVPMVRNLGTHYLAEFKLGEHTLAAKLRQLSASTGEKVWLRLPTERTLFYVNDKRVA